MRFFDNTFLYLSLIESLTLFDKGASEPLFMVYDKYAKLRTIHEKMRAKYVDTLTKHNKA